MTERNNRDMIVLATKYAILPYRLFNYNWYPLANKLSLLQVHNPLSQLRARQGQDSELFRQP